MARNRERREPQALREESGSRAHGVEPARIQSAARQGGGPFAFVLESPRGEAEPSEVNAIRQTKRRSRAVDAASAKESPRGSNGVEKPRDGKRKPDTAAVPEEVRERFVQVGKVFYFPDGARAFTDRGSRLSTPSENTEVVRSLITIARAREWHEIAVTGTERFRREAWLEARKAGIEVRGYKPSEFEQERAARAVGRAKPPEHPSGERIPEGNRVQEEPRRSKREDGLIVGKLVDHGQATYRHEANAPMSYFVRIETAQGDRTVWGIDLGRAFRESLTQPTAGDEVGLRTVRRDPVTVKSPSLDEKGHVVGEKDVAKHRNRWVVEKRAFFDERAAAAKTFRDAEIDAKHGARKHPELVGSYLQLRGAEEVAVRKIRDPQDQQRFVALVREALAASIGRGEPLAPVRLNERQTQVRPLNHASRQDREMVLARE